MPMSDSTLSYLDCKDFLEKAVDNKIGARKWCPNEGEARNFRLRCNYFRKLDRRDTRILYEPGDPLYGKSPYDTLFLTIRSTAENDGAFWVYAQHRKLTDGEVELLSDEDAPLELEPPPAVQLEDQSE